MTTEALASTDWQVPFFAKVIDVTSAGDIIVDGRSVAIFGITLTDNSWPVELRRLLKRRRVYIIPMNCRREKMPTVRLFCGRGDLASYLIWYGRADAKCIHYAHVQVARAVSKLAFLSKAALRNLWGH